MSTIKVNEIQDTSGNVQYTAKAWVNFNGTGTVAIRAAGNVSSITDNATGIYTVNFTNAISDVNYSVVFGGSGAYAISSAGNAWFLGVYTTSAGGAPQVKTTTACKIGCAQGNTAAIDAPDLYVCFFR